MGGFKPKGGSGGGATTEEMYDILLGHDLGAYLKGTVEYFNDLPDDGTPAKGDIYRVQKDGIIFFGKKKGFYQAQVNAPIKDVGSSGWYKVENPALPKYNVNGYDGNNTESYFNYTVIDVEQIALGKCAPENGSIANEFTVNHDYSRLVKDNPDLNDNTQAVNNLSLRYYTKRAILETSLGVDFDNIKAELDTFQDLPLGAGTPAGWTYKVLNDSAGYKAGYYIARVHNPTRTLDIWGWEVRNLETTAKWHIEDGDYMNTTQHYTYAPTGIAAIAQAYCANMTGSADQAFYCKGEGDGDWSMIGGTKYRVTNREDVQQYVAHVTPSWQQATKNMSSTTSDYTLDVGNGLYIYFDDAGTSVWTMKLQNKSGYTRGYCVDGLWENSSGSKGTMMHRINSLTNNSVAPDVIYTNWNNGDQARFRVIEGSSGSNFMPYHEWEIILYQTNTTYLRATWKQLY